MSNSSPEMALRDSMLSWYTGEFAAANAIIDSLCSHVARINGGSSEYEAVFAAIHRRRMNWIQLIHNQRYCSIADVAGELERVEEKRIMSSSVNHVKEMIVENDQDEMRSEKSSFNVRVSSDGDHDISSVDDSSGDCSDQKVHPYVCDSVCEEEEHACLENAMICSDHQECAMRPEKIKICKGFAAREPVKGHMVNVVKGLKVYENIFTESELFKLSEFINELRLAGHRGDLSGESFIYFNKQMKGNKREIIQLGVPLFQPTKEDASSNVEPIPPVIEAVIDHLVQWRLIPEGRRPNSCIINFFDEDEFSQPYYKPPHFDNPISTLVLSDTTLAFGRVLASNPNGNYKGSLTLPLKEGSLIVMRGNSADMARHVICPSENRRVSITFVRVRPPVSQVDSSMSLAPTNALALWQPGPVPIAYGPQSMVPSWGLALRPPVVMFSPPRVLTAGTGPVKRNGRGGTGVFLPWNVGPKKYTKHLPPRIQKRRMFPSFSSPIAAI